MNKLALLSMTWAVAACAGAQTAPVGRDVVTTIEISASPERVLRAFLDEDDLASWWKVSRSLVEERRGGTWAVAWDRYGNEQSSHVWTGVIREVGPRRLIIGEMVLVEPDRALFAPLQLELETEPAENGCVLRIVHRGYQSGDADWEWAHEAVVAGWEHAAADLRDWFRQVE
jgi:uncharacterized protein YndB with AHSA1/START domain